MRSFVLILTALFFELNTAAPIVAQDTSAPSVKLGVTSILSGDLGVLGQNIVDTITTYTKHFARHRLTVFTEDAKLSSTAGLSAYQKLININHVDLIIGGCSSNGTMAAKALINASRTPTITVVTGGRNIDQAGPYIFRIGNSDTLNGRQEADNFIASGLKRVALLAEETEYTQDIANAFRPRFTELGGTLAFQQNFLPNSTDFRSEITLIKKAAPQAILMPTQTGTALGIFVKQWREQAGSLDIPIHTSFVAAPNPDAHKIAGAAILGVYYMAPNYDASNPRWQDFASRYYSDHGRNPPIPFHTAGTVDALDLLQKYLDETPSYSKEGFQQFLLTRVKNYHGLMGIYSFDAEGNTDLGFHLARISSASVAAMD